MKYFFLISILSILLACGSQANESTAETSNPARAAAEAPDISIQVEGLGAGTAYLIGMFTDQRYRVDSTTVDATGMMHFKRQNPYKPGFLFLYLPDRTSLQILVDADQTFSMKTKKGNLVNAMQVEGSLDNELLYKNLKFQLVQQPKLQDLSQKMRSTPQGSPAYQQLKTQQDVLIAERKAHLDEIYSAHPNSFFTIFKKAGQNPQLQDARNPDGTVNSALQVYLYRTAFWDNVDFSDDRLLYTPVISNKLNRYMTELTSQNPDSIKSAASFLIDKVLDHPEYFKFFANWITLKYEPTKTTLMDSEAVFVHMIQNYFTNERAFWSDSVQVYGLQLRAQEMAGSLVGNKGPDVQAKDPSGRLRSIYEIKAPYIVIYMFNPTCEHCFEETPRLQAFYKEWKSKGVEVFTIAIDTEDTEWKNYVAKNNLTMINVFDPTNQSIYGKYYVDVTPEIYVLNPERTIIGKNLKVNQIATLIQRDQQKRR